MRYTFGDFSLDVQHFELKRGETVLALEPKVFAVLCHLVRERERVVSKTELLSALWPDEHVVDSVVVRCIYEARKALGQRDTSAGPIATVRARGYRFIAEVVVSATDAEDVRREPFVGRGAAVRRLLAMLAEARGGRGRVVLLSGEAGIGKTRLAEELALRARESGVDVLVGHCHEGEGSPSFWPFIEIVRACVRSALPGPIEASVGAGFRHLSALLPEAASDVAQVRELDSMRPNGEFLLFDAVARLLQLAAAKQPRMVLIEDLHWADIASLRLLAFLARDIGDKPLLVVGTLRERELTSDADRTARLDHLTRLRRVERLALSPLEQADVEEYVTKLFGRELPKVASALHARSEGFPFFMVEALRPLLEMPLAALEDAQLTLPEATRDIVRQRLARLPERTRNLLRCAAAVGQTFDLTLLSRIGETVDDTGVLGALAPAIQCGVLRSPPGGSGHLEFTHAFMRDVIYGELAPADRLRLHASIAHALGQRSVQPYAELAFHLRNAVPLVEHARVARYCQLAGGAAVAQHAYHDAAYHYEQALLALSRCEGQVEPDQTLELLLSLGHAYRKMDDSERAIRTFERAAQQAKEASRPAYFTRAVLGLRDSQPLRATQATPIEGLLLEALDVLPPGEVVLRARVSSRLAAVGPRAQRREMSARAAALARSVEDPATHADVLNAQLAAAQDPGEIGERLAIADELERLARAHAEPNWLWEARAARFDAYLRLGDRAAADAALDACAALADELHHGVMQLEVLRHRTQRALCTGHYAQATAGMAQASELRKHVSHGLAEVHALVQSLWLMRDLGQLHLIGERMEIFLARHRWAREMAQATVASMYAELGDHERARAGLDYYACTGFENVPYGKDYVATCAHLAVVAATLRDRAAVARIHEMLVPYARQNVVDRMLFYFGSTSHYLGLLAIAMDRDDEAVIRFHAALELNERLGVQPALVRSQLALASLLGARQEHREQAAELVQSAHTIAARIGMHIQSAAEGSARVTLRGLGTDAS